MILGLTGTMGSGKGTFSKYLKQKGFNYISISDQVRKEAEKKGFEIKREALQNIGNLMRKKYGNSYWAKLALRKINENQNWIIDGIRNTGEIKKIKKFPNSFIIAIDSIESIRLRRIEKRNKLTEEGRKNSDLKNKDGLKKAELRDRGFKEPSYGQQVIKCIKMADYKITNNSSLQDFYSKIDEVLRKIK